MSTWQLPARAWRTAFVTASSAIRYAATSTAAGSAGDLVRHAHLDARTVARTEPLGLLPQRADQSELVESRRAQVVDEPADIRHGALDAETCVLQQASGRLGIALEEVLRGLYLERCPRERRPEPVVEVSAQSPALLLTRRDEALACALELGSFRGEGFDEPPAQPRRAGVRPVCQSVHAALEHRAERLDEQAASPVATRASQKSALSWKRALSPPRVRHRP